MSVSSLHGCVSKVPLLVAPAYAQDKSLLQHVRMRLHEAGFVIVREEYRLLNPEMTERLSVTCERAPAYMSSQGTEDGTHSGQHDEIHAHSHPNSKALVHGHSNVVARPSASLMVGTAYVFVLARSHCLTKLLQFLHAFRRSDVVYQRVVEEGRRTSHDDSDHDDGQCSVLWTSLTPDGAKCVVSTLFPKMLGQDIPTAVQTKEYVQVNIKGALIPVLTELAKQKPEDPVRWIARRLLETNVQDPPLLSHNN